jgi:hypothetical protein
VGPRALTEDDLWLALELCQNIDNVVVWHPYHLTYFIRRCRQDPAAASRIKHRCLRLTLSQRLSIQFALHVDGLRNTPIANMLTHLQFGSDCVTPLDICRPLPRLTHLAHPFYAGFPRGNADIGRDNPHLLSRLTMFLVICEYWRHGETEAAVRELRKTHQNVYIVHQGEESSETDSLRREWIEEIEGHSPWERGVEETKRLELQTW